MRSGPIAISALAAGEAQFYGVSATGASLGAMAGGLDLAFVAGFINRLDGYLAVSAKIRTPDDLNKQDNLNPNYETLNPKPFV